MRAEFVTLLSMTNAEIAGVLEQIGMMLDLKGENPFRVRAYERAAQMITSLSRDLKEIYDNEGTDGLKELPGIGEDLALKIEELLKTGKLAYLETVKKSLPEGLFAILGIDGMGPKKTKFVWEKFGVENIDDLEKLAKSGKLEKLKGWGAKSVENILKGIDTKRVMGGRIALHEAWELAEEIVAMLTKTKLCEQVEIAGSLRRRKETIGDIDILVTSKTPEKVIAAFCEAPWVQRVLARGTTKASVVLNAGVQTDLRVVEKDVFGAALHYFTGGKEHNVHLRGIAVKQGVTISEYGVFEGTAAKKGKLLASKTEADVFKTVGLPYIEPELREDRGEIEAGFAHDLPKLITEDDLQGDLHMHTSFSDGSASAADMARAAKKAGLKYIAITDHASPMGMVKGVKEKNITEYLKMITAARKEVPDVQILSGAEVDILPDGTLYLPDKILAKLDWVVASVHGSFKQSRDEMTRRILKAIRNPHVRLIAHPTARMVQQRPPIEFDVDAVFSAAKEHGVALELNASVERLDLNDVLCKRAKEMGVTICISSDAHAVRGLNYRFGISQARRGWLTKTDVANTKSWKEFERWMKSGGKG